MESLDLIKRYRSSHFEILAPSVRTVKILGMQQPIDLAKLYYPTHVSIDIRRRIYKPDWVKIDGTPEVATKGSKTAPLHQRTFEPADKFIEVNHRTVVLGGPGAGKTTFLKYLAFGLLRQSDLRQDESVDIALAYISTLARVTCRRFEYS